MIFATEEEATAFMRAASNLSVGAGVDLNGLKAAWSPANVQEAFMMGREMERELLTNKKYEQAHPLPDAER